MKKLSIIVPVYNQQDLIIRALESIPKRKDIEVVIVNDGSTDNTYNRCLKWMIEEQELKVKICSQVNKGLGSAKNLGFESATGEYITQLDSDDYLITEEYEKVLNELDGTDMIYCNLELNSGEVFKLTPETQSKYCSGCVRFIKRSFLGKTRCPEIRATEDWYLNQELQKKPHTEKYTNITAYHYNFPREGSLYDIYVKGGKDVRSE